jgi:cell division transport system permease protein
MQLVGATRGFVRRPFLLRSAFHGLLAAMLALTLLMAMLYLVEREFFMLFTFEDMNLLLLMMGAIIATGVIMNVVSTFFAVNRYLSIPEDKLYI